MMRSVQLPLFLINEPCSIELTFNTQSAAADVGNLCCLPTGAASNGCSINLESVKFLADYLTYDDDRMDETAKLVMSDQGMVIPYEDVITTLADYQKVAPDPTGDNIVEQNQIRVRSILISQSSQADNASDDLLGKYKSEAYNVPDSLQVRINDRQHFPRPVVSESQKQYQLSQVFSTDIAVLNAEYSMDMATNKQSARNEVTNQMISASTLEGHAMTTLAGKQHYEGVDLSNGLSNAPGSGVEVGQKPVQILQRITRTADNNADRKVRVFSVVERTMNIRGGMVQVSA